MFTAQADYIRRAKLHSYGIRAPVSGPQVSVTLAFPYKI
jgi:hypothetical protein